MEEIAKVLTNYGFAVAVAGYLLIKLQPTIEGFTKELTEFNSKMDQVLEKLEYIEQFIDRRRK